MIDLNYVPRGWAVAPSITASQTGVDRPATEDEMVMLLTLSTIRATQDRMITATWMDR